MFWVSLIRNFKTLHFLRNRTEQSAPISKKCHNQSFNLGHVSRRAIHMKPCSDEFRSPELLELPWDPYLGTQSALFTRKSLRLSSKFRIFGSVEFNKLQSLIFSKWLVGKIRGNQFSLSEATISLNPGFLLSTLHIAIIFLMVLQHLHTLPEPLPKSSKMSKKFPKFF